MINTLNKHHNYFCGFLSQHCFYDPEMYRNHGGLGITISSKRTTKTFHFVYWKLFSFSRAEQCTKQLGREDKPPEEDANAHILNSELVWLKRGHSFLELEDKTQKVILYAKSPTNMLVKYAENRMQIQMQTKSTLQGHKRILDTR